jgi:hypothetical protein
MKEIGFKEREVLASVERRIASSIPENNRPDQALFRKTPWRM